MILPETCDAPLCSCLSARDLIRYGQVCRDTRRAVTDYSTLAFQVKHCLSPFMNANDVRSFRITMMMTGAVISGAVALHYFNRIPVTDTPLEMYVERTHMMELVSFFKYRGYHYRARERQERDLDDAYSLAINLFNDRDDAILDLYSILDMFIFVRGDAEVKIMLVADSALDSILDLHCTPVMNIITFRSAYSLFPYNTFMKKSGLLFVEDNGHIDGYRRRGWRMYRRLSTARYDNFGKEITVCTRYVGDKYTWTIDLDDLAASYFDPILFNSFEVQWSRRIDAYILPQIARLIFAAPQIWTQSRLFASTELMRRFASELHLIQPVAALQNDVEVAHAVLNGGADVLFKDHLPCGTDTFGLGPWRRTLTHYRVPVVTLRIARLSVHEGDDDPFTPDDANPTPEALPAETNTPPDGDLPIGHSDDHIGLQHPNDEDEATTGGNVIAERVASQSSNPLVALSAALQLEIWDGVGDFDVYTRPRKKARTMDTA